MVTYLHTRIDDAMHLRKELLEAALGSTTALKDVELMCTSLGDSHVFRRELKDALRELRLDVVKLKKSLPVLPKEFHGKGDVEREERKEFEKTALVKEHPRDFLSDRERFEEDLVDIKRKIKDLSF